jgi:drug/metabolite transporter (DMT)-like permease
VALFSLLVLQERLSRAQIGGILLSLAGVLVVLTKGSLAVLLAAAFNKGDLFMLLALSIWVFYTIMLKKTAIPAITLTTVIAALSVLLLLPLGWREGMDLAALSPLTWSIIAYIVVFPSVCSFVFWSMGVRSLGAAKAGVFLNLIPVFAALISVALGGELSWPQITGGCLVFLGVYFTTGS